MTAQIKQTKLPTWALPAFFFWFAFLFGVLGLVGGAFQPRGSPTPVRPEELSAARHTGKYVVLQTNQAVEAGYRYRGDPNNKTARLLAVPVGDKVLIVQVLMNHTGSSFAGTVGELPSDVSLAVSLESIRSLMEDTQQRRKGLTVRRGADGRPELPKLPPPEPSVSELVLPIFLDATDEGSGLRVLVVVLTVAFLLAGMVTLVRARRLRGTAPLGPTGSPNRLEQRVCSVCGTSLGSSEQRLGLCNNCYRKAL
jgi:hypothetical protein